MLHVKVNSSRSSMLHAGFLGPVSRLQQLLEEPDVNQKEVVLYVVHAAHIQPATVMPLLMMMLQQEEVGATASLPPFLRSCGVILIQHPEPLDGPSHHFGTLLVKASGWLEPTDMSQTN